LEDSGEEEEDDDDFEDDISLAERVAREWGLEVIEP